MFEFSVGNNEMATLFLSIILTVSFVLRVTDGQALGFVLKGQMYPNGSTVLRTDIGASENDALQCTTDSTDCCKDARIGEFYFPNGSRVLIMGSSPSNSYYRTRSSRLISLHRRLTAMQTGQFRCAIPSAGSGTQTVDLFINILNIISLSITASGTSTVGETYSLECSATVTGSTDQPTITWLDPMNNTVPSDMVTTTDSMSTLTFNPLAASHAGTYTCRVTAGGVTETQTSTVIVNAFSISLSITPSGTNTAGETYSLECSATVTGSTDQPTITWLDPMNNPTDSMSTLTFNPLEASHAGTYTCSVTAGGVTETQTSTVIVNVITAQVTRSSSGPLTARQTGFSLSCDVTGTENLNTPTFTYQWRRNGGVIPGQQGSTLSLSPLTASNAGEYNCSVTVSSTSLSSTVTVNSGNTETVSIQLPAPTSVTVTNGSVNAGSDVTLTCTVELSPAVDVPVTVNTVWTGPDGFMTTNTAQPVMGSTTTYTSTAMVSSFGRNQSGDYTCTATVSSTSLFITDSTGSSSTRVTVGVYLSLKGVVYPNNSDILITEIEQTNTTSNNGLQCITDRRPCCASSLNRHGEWLFPDGGMVPTVGSGASRATTFYRNRGDDGTVNLNRVDNDVMMPTRRFCCVVPDVIGVNQTVCANIVLQVPTTLPPSMSATTKAGSESSSNPSSSSSDPTGGQQGTGPDTGVIAGAIVIVIVLIAVAVIVVIVVLVVFRRRKSEKLLTDTPTKARPTSIKTRPAPPVAYSKTHNGDKVSGVGRKLDAKILKFPSDMTITEGEGVYFKIKVSGVPQPTVTWYHDGEPVKADYAREVEEDGSLAIPSTELKHSGVYKAVVANQHGSEEREVKLTVSEEGGARRAVQGDIVSTRPIPIPEFGKYTAELHANSNQPFRDLFQALDDGENGHTTDYANDPERKLLNRFGNIVVYDDNKIPLQPIPDTPDCQEDYINACYVDGYSLPNKFIATQGPLPKTVVDFWRLIWQERPPTIVMVTNVKEGNRIKCQQYWPDSGKKEFGPFQVIITDQQVFADYTIRTLSLSLGSGRSHKVTQYHFTAWPDHGVPDYATPILAFHRRVKAQHHPSRGPMVVHCSAGVGRTGTFIVIDNILEQIEKEQVVDIPGAITKIRQKRMKMVQSLEQFAFIHDAILESVTCGDTQISATNLRVAITKMKKKDPLNQLNAFQHQFKILEQVTPKPEEVQSSQARSFPDRNRGALYLPANRWRVILKGEHPDYIHAVNINGYKQHKAFIIAQGPMDSTVRNFWKMVFDRKCAVIVMVSGLVERGEESSTQYWPSSGTYQYGEYTVDLLGEEPLEGFTIRDLSVIDNESEKAHKVTQFHITCWTADGRCSNLRSITDVIEEITKVQIRSGNKPIVVHCNDTVTRSGMFCAIATTIERCKTEGVVDVFQVVKALRVQKPGAVPNVDQYKVIFDSVLVFLESFDTYANFQNI